MQITALRYIALLEGYSPPEQAEEIVGSLM